MQYIQMLLSILSAGRKGWLKDLYGKNPRRYSSRFQPRLHKEATGSCWEI